jgi:hypothetical protein
MRLLELRLIEDPRSSVRFPGHLTVVAGMAPGARAWLCAAVPAFLDGRDSGLAAYVHVDGSTREVGPGATALRFAGREARVVLDAGPFDEAIARHAQLVAAGAPVATDVVVTAEQVARSRAALDQARRSLEALERGTELTRAEHRGAVAAGEDLAAEVAAARAIVDPMAPIVLDRALDSAARLEVETGAPPGVCRGETEATAKERIVRLETALYELDSALQTLVPIDAAAVEQALDIVRIITATGPIELPEAIRLAEEYRSLRAQIAALEERIAADEGGMANIGDRLDQARARYAAAEARMQPVQADASEIAALERAHDAVLEAEKKVSGLFGNRSRKLLDDAVAEERAILERLGYPTWSAFIMGARMLDSAAENKRELELARRELDEAERLSARVMARMHDEPEFLAHLDRLERLQEAAHAIVGDVDDVEVALRALRVDPGPPPMTVDAARENLAACLLDVGFEIEDHATLDDLVDAARAWLDDVCEIAWLHTQLEADARHCAAELDATRETLERLQVVGATEEIDGFGAERLRAARATIARADERLWSHRDAVIRVAQLVAESERVMDLQIQLAASLERAEELVRITRELAEASAERCALLESAFAATAPLGPDADAPADAPADAGPTGAAPTGADTATGTDGTPAAADAARALPERVDLLAEVLEERITALRDAGIDGSLPLLLDDPFRSCTPTERAELLGWLEGYSLFLQIVYLADGPEAVAWAEGRNTSRVRVVHGEGFFG